MKRYTYLGDKLTRADMKGAQLDAVRDRRGKCIVSRMGTMLCRDGEGRRQIVLRRRLRVNKIQAELFGEAEI